MQDVFVWFYGAADRPRGVPLPLNTTLADKPGASRQLPRLAYPWVRYNPYQMAFPPTDPALRLPEQLFFIVRQEREVLFDFLYFKDEYKIVSQDLLDFLTAQGLPQNYEAAVLTVVNPAGKPLTRKKYWALRFGRFDDHRLQFDAATRVPAADLPSRYLYPGITAPAAGQSVFVVDQFCYREALLLTAAAKREAEQRFYAPLMYAAAAFVDVFQQNQTW